MIKADLFSILTILKPTHRVRSVGALLAAVTLLGAVAAGCGGNGSDEAEPAAPAPAPPTVQEGTSDETSTSATTGVAETDTTVDSSTGEEEGAVGPQPLPTFAQPLAEGAYTTSTFAPAFSFVVDQPVATAGPELPNAVALDLGTGAEATFLTFFNDSMTLLDPESEHTIDRAPEPDDAEVTSPDSLVTWLTDHPRLDVSEPEDVTIGGVPATQVTVDIAEGQGYESPNCPGTQCVLLFGTPQFSYFAEDGRRIRLQVLETGGRTLAITTEPPIADYDAGAALADQLLATVAFE